MTAKKKYFGDTLTNFLLVKKGRHLERDPQLSLDGML